MTGRNVHWYPAADELKWCNVRSEMVELFTTGLTTGLRIATATRADLARLLLDRKRTKQASNQDWTPPRDPDARISHVNNQN